MKPSDMIATLTSLIGVAEATPERPPTAIHVWGPPGVGKSDVIRQVAGKLGREVVDIRAVLLDPVDLRGLPKVNGDDRAHWCPPAFLPTGDSTALVFLDELPAAPPLVQNACLQLILDRRLGEYHLPPGCVMVAAGNRIEDRAGAHRLTTALSSRFIHLDLDVDIEDWRAWAIENGIHESITSFIAFKDGYLHQFDASSGERVFPCPRTWAMASHAMSRMPTRDKTALQPVLAGCVGKGAAAEFLAFCETYLRLPDIQKILRNPEREPIPEKEPSLLYAFCGALVTALRQKPDVCNAFAAVVNRLPPEFGVLAMRDGTRALGDKWQTLTTCPAGRAFLREHTDLFLSE